MIDPEDEDEYMDNDAVIYKADPEERFSLTRRALLDTSEGGFAILFLCALGAGLVAAWFFPLVDHVMLGLLLAFILVVIGCWAYDVVSSVLKAYRKDRDNERTKIVRDVMES
jgi:hypothetical protein